MATYRETPTMSAMEHVAYNRLRRFNRIAAVAETSESPLWRRLAERSARAALRDYLIVGLTLNAAETSARPEETSRAA